MKRPSTVSYTHLDVYKRQEEESSESLSEEEELEQFIDSIQPKDKRNPSDIVPREKSLTDDEKKLFTYFVKVPGMREQLISAPVSYTHLDVYKRQLHNRA